MIRRPITITEKSLSGEHDDMPFIIFDDHIEVKKNAKLKPEEKALIDGG